MAISAIGVLIICFLANASVLLPSSSVLIVVEYSMIINPLIVAACGALGAALGEMTGFYVGRCGRGIISKRITRWVETKMKRHRYLVVLIFATMPLPLFDIVGMISGTMKMNALKFFGVCFVGKMIKMLCYVGLARQMLLLTR